MHNVTRARFQEAVILLGGYTAQLVHQQLRPEADVEDIADLQLPGEVDLVDGARYQVLLKDWQLKKQVCQRLERAVCM